MRPFSMFDTVDQAAAPPAFGSLRKNQSSEDILRDAQVWAWARPGLSPHVLEGVRGVGTSGVKPAGVRGGTGRGHVQG